ncbi:hypothetical protein V7139_16435 [Neobacillus drentensis]
MNLCERCRSVEANISLHMEPISMQLYANCYNELMAEVLDVKLES